MCGDRHELRCGGWVGVCGDRHEFRCGGGTLLPRCSGPLGFGGRLGRCLQGHWVKRDGFFLFLFFQINVRVTTMDAELEFAIQPNTTGKQLFDQVGLCTLERVSS